MPSVAKICDRHNVSNTVGATATLVDFGLITNDNKVIDRSQLWQEREKNRQK